MKGIRTMNMSRKEFLRSGLSSMAVAGLPTTGVAAAAVAGASPAAESGPVTLTTLNPTIRLYPAKALGRMGDIRFGTAEIGTMMPFLGAGEITWTVSVPEAESGKGSCRERVCQYG